MRVTIVILLTSLLAPASAQAANPGVFVQFGPPGAVKTTRARNPYVRLFPLADVNQEQLREDGTVVVDVTRVFKSDQDLAAWSNAAIPA